MKITVIVVCAVLFSALQAPALLASELKEYRDDAKRHYLEHDFKKAYKIYYKLAKAGDHYSQDRVSQMYANGEGKTTDLTEAYAWSVLAAEGGKEEWVESSDELLQLTQDQSRAQGKADKLIKKYGEETLKAKADERAKRESRPCTGSRLCSSH